MAIKQRIHGMDALRAIAMLLGVVLHAAIVYQKEPRPGWPSDDSFHTIGFDFLYHWVHSFRMPLFFLVAGFFARFLYLKIGESDFVKRRIKRILIPFIISVLVLLPFSAYPFIYNRLLQQGLPESETAIKAFAMIFSWNGLYHLWFLYYLMAYYITMLIAYRIKAFVKINSLKYFRLDFIHSSLAIALTAIILYVYADKYIEPWTGLTIKAGQYLFYGSYFLIGFLIHKSFSDFYISKKTTWALLIAGTLLTPLFIFSIQNDQKLIANVIASFQTYLLTFGTLGTFLNYFDRESKMVRYISDSAYWLYLIHFPIVANMQILLKDSFIPGYLRFWIVLGITTFICIWTYEKFVRYTLIGDILHGKRFKEKPELVKG